MSGSVVLGGQTVNTGTATVTQGVATVGSTGISGFDSSDLPVVIAGDANNPARKVSPEGAVTLLAPTVSGPLANQQDNSVTFSQQVREVWIKNLSPLDVYVWPDSASSLAAWPILAGEWQTLGVLCTVLHVFPNAPLGSSPTAQGIEANQPGGLYIAGGL